MKIAKILRCGSLAALAAIAAGTATLSSSRAATRASDLRADKIPALADASLLREAGIAALAEDSETGVAFARLSSADQARLSRAAHAHRRCGGYEALPEDAAAPSAKSPPPAAGAAAATGGLAALFAPLRAQARANAAWAARGPGRARLEKKPEVERAVAQVREENVRATTQKLSAYPTRYNQGPQPNLHVDDFAKALRAIASSASFAVEVEAIAHDSTPQKSLRARVKGASRASEIVVIGGHLDSINQSYSGESAAPGADDNASGSAAVLEAFRVVAASPAPPARTIDFFWYAGEESGLLGSAEIARSYKGAGADVVGVLQLDMVLFPGSGSMTLASMTDFTSAWLRDYLVDLNRLYLNMRIVESQCGYGCSDHASWYRQGYPTLMPAESVMDAINPNLHTAQDAIDGSSDFAHAAGFARLATAFAVDLGNSSARPQ
jgi:leucyl aminopeptidase